MTRQPEDGAETGAGAGAGAPTEVGAETEANPLEGEEVAAREAANPPGKC